MTVLFEGSGEVIYEDHESKVIELDNGEIIDIPVGTRRGEGLWGSLMAEVETDLAEFEEDQHQLISEVVGYE